MSNPEFRLLPWERGGHPIAPAVKLSATVEGRSRRFHVKTHDGLIYFRFADEEKYDDRIWTLLLPAPESENDLEAFFQIEVEANRVARFFCISRSFSTRTVGKEFESELQLRFHASNLHLYGPSAFAVAVSQDGYGFAQEWCGGRWVEFILPTRKSTSGAHAPSIWHRGWRPIKLRNALALLAGQFAFRPFVPPVVDLEEVHFQCGSLGELKDLVRMANIYFVGQCMRRGSPGVPSWERQRNSSLLQYTLQIDAQTQQGDLSFYHYYQITPLELLKLLVTYNKPIGGQWKTCERLQVNFEVSQFEVAESDYEPQAPWIAPVLRIDFYFAPYKIQVREQVPREPSAHERMEAYLTLRDWLHGKVPPAEIEKLLA